MLDFILSILHNGANNIKLNGLLLFSNAEMTMRLILINSICGFLVVEKKHAQKFQYSFCAVCIMGHFSFKVKSQKVSFFP